MTWCWTKESNDKASAWMVQIFSLCRHRSRYKLGTGYPWVFAFDMARATKYVYVYIIYFVHEILSHLHMDKSCATSRGYGYN